MKSFLTKGLVAIALATSFSVPMTVQTSAKALECGHPYKVARGDSLSKISKRAYGTTDIKLIYAQNRSEIGKNPNRLRVGQLLDIPCVASAATETKQQKPVQVASIKPAIVSTDGMIETVTSADAGDADVQNTVYLTFNKAAAPGFVINTGIIDLYLDEVTEITDGRVQFVDPIVVNHDPAAQYDLVTSGVIDGAYVLNSHLEDSHPLLQLPMLPLHGGSAEQTAVSMWRLHEDHLSKTNYLDEVKLLGFVASPAAHIWRDQSAPVTPEENILDKNVYPTPYFQSLDVRGPKKLRGEIAAWMEREATLMSEPPTFFLAHGAARALGVWNKDLHVTEVDYGVYTPTFSVVLSNDAWSKISPQDQAAIMTVSGEKLSMRSASWDAFDNGFRSDMLVNGLNFLKADDALLAALKTRSDAGVAEWVKTANALGLSGEQAVRDYRSSLQSLEDRLLFK